MARGPCDASLRWRPQTLRRPLSVEYFNANVSGRSNDDIFAHLFPWKSAEERRGLGAEKEERFRACVREGGLESLEGLSAFLDRLLAGGVVTNAPR